MEALAVALVDFRQLIAVAHHLEVLLRQDPEVVPRILVPPLHDGVVSQLLQDLPRQVRSPGLLVRLLRFLEPVADGKPLGVRQEDVVAEAALVGGREHERLLPVVQLDVELHEGLDVVQLDVDLLGELVVVVLAAKVRALLQHRLVALVHGAGNLHELVEPAVLAGDHGGLHVVPAR